MQVGIMKTDGGPHSADKWALVTTGQIMHSVFSTAAGETAAARKFEIALLDILAPHHENVQDHERAQIEKHGHERLAHPIDPREHCAAVVADIVEAAEAVGEVAVDGKAIDLGAHFAKTEVQQALAGLIGSHFASAMDIERSYHADRHATHPDAKAYREARNNHGAAHVHLHMDKYRKG